jgi:hypothetical protein
VREGGGGGGGPRGGRVRPREEGREKERRTDASATAV